MNKEAIIMIKKRKFGIIGGDLRALYLAKSLNKDGNEVRICGTEKLNSRQIFQTDTPDNVINSSDYIILPTPVTRDNKTINAPYSLKELLIDKKFLDSVKGKIIFGGIIPDILKQIDKKVKNKSYSVEDYYTENFKILNSIPTAEGAIKIALEEKHSTICQSKCLVIGYGKIGKILSKILKNMGAYVTVSARKSTDRAWACAEGYKSVNILETQEIYDYDFIFNTVPHILLNENILKSLRKDVLIIDLASPPGGVDKEAASKLNIKSIHALAIPGKYFPESAAEIIKSEIYSIMKEKNL